MAEKIVFRYFGKKTIILDQKIEVLNRAKKWTFFKRVSPWILSKSLTFLIGVFHINHMRKDRFWYCGKKRIILRGKNWSFKRGQKLTFSKGVSPWILSKNRTFSYRRFSHKSYEKRSFLILWKEKNNFKRKKLKF